MKVAKTVFALYYHETNCDFKTAILHYTDSLTGRKDTIVQSQEAMNTENVLIFLSTLSLYCSFVSQKAIQSVSLGKKKAKLKITCAD